jgi:hypothetical protein
VNLGAENKFELGAAILLGIIAMLSVGHWLTNSGAPRPATATPAPKTVAARPLIDSLDPTIRTDLLDSAQNVEYRGKGRNIFRAGATPLPQPVTPVITAKGNPGPVVPQGPPPPPPINLKFFGIANRAGEPQRIFLSEGESIFVAHEGDIVNSRYKVVKVNPQSVEIEDLLNNNRQSIPLTQG